MRSSRVTPFLLSTLLCGALVATGMGEGRLGMADDLESPVVSAPDQIESEPPTRLSADLSGEIDRFDDRAEDYHYDYCYGYEYASQQGSSKDDADVTDDRETEDDSYDSEEFVYDGPYQETDVEDHDCRDHGEWDSEYGYQGYDDYEYAAEDTQDVTPLTADDAGDEEYTYEDDEEYTYEDDEEYTYGYEYEYMSDKYVDDSDEATESDVEDAVEDVREGGFAYEYDEEYSYDYEDEYGAPEAAQSDVEDDIVEIQEDSPSYEYDDCNSRYCHEYIGDDVEPVETAELDAEAEETETSYDYSSWEDEYDSEYDNESRGYTTEYDEYREYTYQSGTEEVQADDSDTQFEETGSWESEDEYEDYTYESEDVQADESDYDFQLEASNSWESEDEESAEWESEDDEYEDYTYESESENVQADETDYDFQLEASNSWGSEDEESAEWESEYEDYTYESESENAQADETDYDFQLEASNSWESEDEESAEWESEYDYSNDVGDEMEAGIPAEDDLGMYGGYTDAYPEEEYAYPGSETREVVQEDPESSRDDDEFGYECYDADVAPAEELAQDDYWTEYGYEYSYPETKYGSASATEEESKKESRLEGEFGEPTYAVEECPEEDLPCGVELFAWHPNELLSYQDQEFLKTLERFYDDPSGVRRATLNDYLEEEGSEAIEFAGRFEDSSGIDVLGLADDLPQTAAFLASFRLLQRGELGIDEAVDVLRHSLTDLSPEWIEGVRGITADAFDDWDAGIEQSEDESADWFEVTSTVRPIVVAMASITKGSISGAKGAITAVSAQLADMELSTVLSQLSEN